MKAKTKRQKKTTLEDLVTEARKQGVDVKLCLEPIVTISLSKRMEDDLKILAKSGLYGLTVQDAARRILEQWLLENPVIAWREPARA